MEAVQAQEKQTGLKATAQPTEKAAEMTMSQEQFMVDQNLAKIEGMFMTTNMPEHKVRQAMGSLISAVQAWIQVKIKEELAKHGVNEAAPVKN